MFTMNEKPAVKTMSLSLDTVIEKFLQSKAEREDRKVSAVARRIFYEAISREIAEEAQRPEPTP